MEAERFAIREKLKRLLQDLTAAELGRRSVTITSAEAQLCRAAVETVLSMTEKK